MQRLIVSLPAELVRKVRRVSHETGLKMSRVVARALEEYLSEEVQTSAEPPLEGGASLRGPSPRLTKAHVGSWRSIDLDELPL